ncbi:MAG: ADOP family duplicated permease, partial [Gemmatimonadetes bacterium]|nr:ADOP family duplicated permease [Gemmatimonadota bacterium]
MKRAMRPGDPGASGARREVEEELAFHLEAVAGELVDEGWAPEAARREAERRFGDLAFTRDYCAEATARRRTREGWTMKGDEIRQDLAFAVRTLRRSPGYGLVVVVTLAVAIAAISTVFGVMNPYFVRPLPYGDADRLVQLGWVDAASGYSGIRFSPAQVADLRDRSRALEAVGSYHYGTLNLADEGTPERVQAAFLGGDLFDLLDVDAALGRTFRSDEEGPAGADVVALSDALWRSRYGADPGVLGSTIRLDGTPHTVVGVMGPRFNFPFNGIRLWVPDRADPAGIARERQARIPVARLGPGWTREAATRELAGLHGALAAEHPGAEGRFDGVAVTPLREALNFGWEALRIGFALLLGAVGFLFLIACVNVSGLGLARAASRSREVAVRTALGAGRGRIVRQLLTESLTLAVVAGAAGVALAALAVGAVAGLLPEDLDRVGDASMDPGVLLVTVAATLVAPLFFGLAPAVAAARHDLAASMKEAGSGGEGAGRLRGRRALVVAQVALAVVLVTGAGMMGRAFLSIRALDLGHDPSRVLVVEVTPPASEYPAADDLSTYYTSAVDRAAAVPGVESVGTAAWLPMNHETLPEGYALPSDVGPADQRPTAIINRVGDDYFAAMDIDVVAGRAFDDAVEGRPVVMVGRRLAASLWPDGGAVGATLLLGRDDDPVPATVVGVAEDVQHSDRLGDGAHTLYRPLAQSPVRRRFLVLRAADRPEALVGPVRSALLAVDPDLPLTLRPMPEIVRESTIGFSLGAGVLGGFGLLALLLAALGLSGLLAYTVARRRREMGVRLALGATPGRLRAMVVGDGLKLVAVGAALGIGLTLALGRVVAAAIPRAGEIDPATLALVLGLFGLVAAGASWVPALRGRMTASEAL